MTRRSPHVSDGRKGMAMMTTPYGRDPLDPEILRIVQALARADEAADYRASQEPAKPKAA